MHVKRMRKNNDNKALVPKLWGWLWTLTRLIRVDYMYSFMLYNVIMLSTIVLFVTSIKLEIKPCTLFRRLNFVSYATCACHKEEFVNWNKPIHFSPRDGEF